MPTHVILFGWMGAQRRHVSKYADMYAAAPGENFRTTIAIADPADIMLIRRDQLVEYGVGILEQVEADSQDDGPIVVHCFSNGGVFVWNFLLRLAHGLDPPPASISEEQVALIKRVCERVDAEIFDSAPCYLLLRSGVSAIDVGLAGNGFARISLKIAFLLGAGLQALVDKLRGRPAEPERYWERVTASPCSARQLYIYSDADPICDVPALEALIEARAARGIQVSTLHFETSNHVAHFRVHPDEYREACLRHVAPAPPPGTSTTNTGT